MTSSFHRFGNLCLLAAILAGGAACSTVRSYDDQFSAVYSSYRLGNAETAAASVTGKTHQKKFRSNDRLLWTMEAGKLLHLTDDFEGSNRYFEQAEEIIKEFEDRADLNVRGGFSQLGALATNPNALPYRGSYAEKILINTYKALNYLALGDLEAARVEIRRSYERQQQALRENEAAIDEAKQQARTRNLDASATYESPALRKAAPVDPSVAQAYADFSNPFTTLLSGLVALADRDPARAEVDFRLLASLPIPNTYVEEELERIENQLGGRDGDGNGRRSRVYVIFENGLGPVKQEMRVDLILPQIGYTGFAFPQVVFHPSEVHSLRLSPEANESFLTERIASIDQVVATEFQTRMPAMVLRTVTSVIAKEVLAKQLTDELDVIGLLLGSIYKAVVNRADTRTWKTLGKEFQFAAFDYTPGGTLHLSLIGRNKNELMKREAVQLPDGEFVLVLVRSVNQHDLRVTTRSLR